MTGFDSKRKAALDEDGMYLVHHTAQPDATMQSLKDLWRSVCDEVGKAAFAQPAPSAQRPWVEPTSAEWFEWWRVSQVANETEVEIDFADFLIIAQAVTDKLKGKT